MGVVTQHYRHSQLGHVYILVKPTARSIKAWWKGPVLHVTCPAVTPKELERALDSMAPALLSKRPRPKFAVGQTLAFDLFKVEIAGQSALPGVVTIKQNPKNVFTLGVGAEIDLSTEAGEKTMDSALCQIAKHYMADILNEAHYIAIRVGTLPPDGFERGRGRKRLGCCINGRRISLSFMLAFMPKHLRELIYCHELAHLTHMDHSPSFHALVDRYTNGNEARLEVELRAFKFPVNR